MMEPFPHSSSSHKPRNKSLSYPKSPRLGFSSTSTCPHDANATPRKASTGSTAIPTTSSYNSVTYPHSPSAPHPTRSGSTSSASSGKSPIEVKHGKRPGQIWMPEGVVDMGSFGPILAMDETDATREFSKALVWAWCDQAEMVIEEMEQSLQAGEIVPIADKAHYLKGSSSSLGLVKVSSTCQALYHIHYPPSLAHLRAFSYTGKGNSELSTNSHSSGSSSSSSSAASPYGTAYNSDTSSASSVSSLVGAGEKMLQDENLPSSSSTSTRSSTDETLQSFPFGHVSSTGSSRVSPGLYSPHVYAKNAYTSMFPHGIAEEDESTKKAVDDSVAAHFERLKFQRAQALIDKLKADIKEGSDWLYAYYRESDKYAGVTSERT